MASKIRPPGPAAGLFNPAVNVSAGVSAALVVKGPLYLRIEPDFAGRHP